jgi:geranylgeranyl pyrophosphate synthase
MNSLQGLETPKLLAGIEEEIVEVSKVLTEAASINFPLLEPLLQAIINAGGKRLRPHLTLLSALVPGTPEKIDALKLRQVAAAVEMLHTATLVHDDTIDNALLRRGFATLNSQLSSGTVILVGDYLFAQSAILITRPGNPRIVQIFAECLAAICEGELTQIFSSREWKQAREDYYKRIYCKTAALFATACEMGAIMGGAEEELVSRMRRFGHMVGMAFQIVDDVIDFQPAAVTGKATGGDLKQGIVTLPTMNFFEKASKEDANFVKKVIQNKEANDQDIAQAVELIKASGAFEAAYEEARDYIQQAKELVSDQSENEAIRALLNIADYALKRDK